MIIGKDQNPERQIYYLGGLILECIKTETNEIDFFEAFKKINTDREISMNLYTFSLDWLFLLGLIEQKGGKIIKCS
ncbi:MAG: ABC-three component system middle component 6 [archaeon]